MSDRLLTEVQHARTPGLELAAGLGLGAAAAAAVLAGAWPSAILAAAALLAAFVWWVPGAAERWLLAFFAGTLLLPPLPLAAGDTGPHLALIAAAAGLWYGLAGLGDWRFRAEALDVSLVAFAAVLLASAGWACLYAGSRVALGSFARAALFGIGVYAFLFAARGPLSRQRGASALLWVRRLYLLGCLSALLACIDFLLQFPPVAGFGEQYVWLRGGVYRRAQGVFYESGVLGNLCSFFLVVTVAAWLRPELGRKIARPAFRLAGGMILFLALVFSFSRAALLHLAAALITLLWLERRNRRVRRAVMLAGSAFAASAGLGFVLFPEFVEGYFVRLWMTGAFLSSSPELWTSGRLETWLALLARIASEPLRIFFGAGYKTLPYSTDAGGPLIADNMYLSLLAETGVVGLMALGAMLAAVFGASFRAACSSEPVRSFLGICAVGFWAGQLVHMMAADILTYWRVLPVYFVWLGLQERHGEQDE